MDHGSFVKKVCVGHNRTTTFSRPFKLEKELGCTDGRFYYLYYRDKKAMNEKYKIPLEI